MAEVSGGAALRRKMREIANGVRNSGTLRVGFLEDATYPDGTPVALIAAIHDGGAPGAGIPPRPFFRNMIAEKAAGWPERAKRLLRLNRYDGRKTLEMMGEGIAGQLRQSIVDTNDPALKAETIRRKGFAKPLVETGHMLASVDYEVTE